MFYYEGYLIVFQNYSLRFLPLSESEITTTIAQFQSDMTLGGTQLNCQVLEKEFSGVLQQDRIVGAVFNPMRKEIVVVCATDALAILYYRLVVNRGSDKRQLQLAKYEPAPEPKKKARFEKRVSPIVPSEVMQLHLVRATDNMPVLIILRKNQSIEIVYNFTETIFVDTRLNFARILPCFGEHITYQFNDGTIGFAPSFDRLAEKNYLREEEYYRQQLLPPKESIQYDIHRALHFYQDSVIVNQTLFLVRDNAIILVDTFTRKVIQTYLPSGGFLGAKILSLHKLRQQTAEDAQGFKITTIKVVAVH